MRCPECNGVTSVTDSRPKPRNNTIMRRRRCNECAFRFITRESLLGSEGGSRATILRMIDATNRYLEGMRTYVKEHDDQDLS